MSEKPQSHPFISYLRLKSLATIIRLGAQARGLTGKPSPDSTLEVPTRAPGRTLQVHVYTPPNPQSPSPVLLNWHGSGFVLPLHGTDSLFCRRIARETGHTVLDAPYRLAPEHPFPAALEDAEDLLAYVAARPEAYDAQRLAVSGFSAGANLALVAASNPRSAVPRDAIKAVVAFYPVTNLSVDPGAKRAPDGSPGSLAPFIGRLFNGCYVLPAQDKRDPRVSPGFAEPGGFPARVLFVTCGRDNLAPEAEELAGKVRGCEGKGVWVKRIEGVEHAWDKTEDEGSEDARKRDEAYKLAVDFLNGVDVVVE